jgi:hypothetical protein
VSNSLDPKWLEAENEQMRQVLSLLQPYLTNSFALLHPPAETAERPAEVHPADTGSNGKLPAKQT